MMVGRIAGYKPLYYESNESLNKYMIKHLIDSNLTYVGKDSLSDIKLYSLQQHKGKILTFDKAGILQNYVEKNTCPGPVENYLNGICKRKPINMDSTVTLKKIIPLLKPITGDNDLKINESADLTFIIFWAVCYGKNNRDLDKWYMVIKDQEKDCNINVLFLNNDFKAVYYGFKHRKKVKAKYGLEIPN